MVAAVSVGEDALFMVKFSVSKFEAPGLTVSNIPTVPTTFQNKILPTLY
jgi:hypothetical protein